METLPFIDAAAVRAATPWPELIAALREMFRAGCVLPPRHHHAFAVPGERDGTLLLMPAWRTGGTLGVKVVNIVPGNDARGLPAVSAVYLLFSAVTGQPLVSHCRIGAIAERPSRSAARISVAPMPDAQTAPDPVISTLGRADFTVPDPRSRGYAKPRSCSTRRSRMNWTASFGPAAFARRRRRS